MQPAILINRLSYIYPDGTPALQDINLTILTGEKVALMGVNGAGKSTLLNHLNGILIPSQGSVSINGLPVSNSNLPKIRGMVGVVFQHPDDQLFSPTVHDDVAFGPIHLGWPKAEVAIRVENALAQVHLSGYEQRAPYRLSGGEKKRAAIASVLSMQPQVLVLDEPSSGLDPRTRRQLMELLKELPQTMLIATHDLTLAKQLTDRLVIMASGRIAADGRTQQLGEDEPLMLRYGLL